MNKFISRLSLSGFLVFSIANANALQNLSCHVAVIGGGPGGVHTAYQLAKLPSGNPDSNVCLFEKENKLGGRIDDVAMDPSRPDLVFGKGALRVMETQNYLFKLAADLDITLEAAPFRDDLISARGFLGFNSDRINKRAYPLVADTAGMENALYDKLRFGPERANVTQYPDFRSYVNAVAGTQGYHFLADVFRFRADFEATLDARGYLDYLDEEWDVCCTPSYPEGGMSQFVIKMAQDATVNGAKIYLSEPALTLDSESGGYVVTTPNYKVTAKKLIIAAPKIGLHKIGGTIAEAIKKQAQFRDLVGIPVATVTQRWPNAWWTQLGYPGKDIHRIWTTEHCFNFMEIPIAAYAAQQLVTRTVYSDKAECVAFWQRTSQLGIKAVEEEINRGLHYVLPNANIPQPLNTAVQIWPGAWYWLRGGSEFTNADIASWAVEPLPGEQVSLVGESYNPQRSGWSDGAYKSSINTLNAKYGFNIVVPAAANLSSMTAKRTASTATHQSGR